eukprot:scaffold199_cov489-Pavlova_lutheri.AAC.1
MTQENCKHKSQTRIANFQLHVITTLLLSNRITTHVDPWLYTGYRRCRCDATLAKTIPRQRTERWVDETFLRGSVFALGSQLGHTHLLPRTITSTWLVESLHTVLCSKCTVDAAGTNESSRGERICWQSIPCTSIPCSVNVLPNHEGDLGWDKESGAS